MDDFWMINVQRPPYIGRESKNSAPRSVSSSHSPTVGMVTELVEVGIMTAPYAGNQVRVVRRRVRISHVSPKCREIT